MNHNEDFGPRQRPTLSEKDAERLERKLAYRSGLARMLSKRPHDN